MNRSRRDMIKNVLGGSVSLLLPPIPLSTSGMASEPFLTLALAKYQIRPTSNDLSVRAFNIALEYRNGDVYWYVVSEKQARKNGLIKFLFDCLGKRERDFFPEFRKLFLPNFVGMGVNDPHVSSIQ
jgi:hypothetical protein